MIVQGSVNHSFSGRKRGVTKSRKMTKKRTGAYVPSTPYRRETKDYPSLEGGSYGALKKDTTEQAEISSKFTVAPAYNKGAYQVISKEDIKHIGQ